MRTDNSALQPPVLGKVNTMALREPISHAFTSLLNNSLTNVSGQPTHTLTLVGPPGSGKTQVAVQLLVESFNHLDDTQSVMAVPNRQIADRYSDEVIRHLKATSQARPVTTLSALAFRVISAVRERKGESLPKLLNGAEQDALLRKVMAQHIHHAITGDICDTCALLREYFAVDDWSHLVADMDGVQSAETHTSSNTSDQENDTLNPSNTLSGNGDQADPTSTLTATTESIFMRGINDAFVVQLRDMLSRMNELGASWDREDEILDALGQWSPRTERLRVQWRLAFALRHEYARMIAQDYATQYRLDSSMLLVEGTRAVAQALPQELAQLVIVDDFQDLTIAGLGFLNALANVGIKLIVIGNPDESVQTFRGAYPEYLFARLDDEPFYTAHIDLAEIGEPTGNATVDVDARNHAQYPLKAPTYHDLVASRISLSILSNESGDVPLPERPGKMPRYEATLPIRKLPIHESPIDELSQDGGLAKDGLADDGLPNDGSVNCAEYRSATEELDDVVWQLKHEHVNNHVSWNDMALIAHDNATVRAFGERLRQDGVPVRYSSVTKPLNSEPFVQGLFALIELAQLRNEGIAGDFMTLRATAGYVRSRVRMVMDSPLLAANSNEQAQGVPARIDIVERTMNALESLASVVEQDDFSPENPMDSQNDEAEAKVDSANISDTTESADSATEAVDRADFNTSDIGNDTLAIPATATEVAAVTTTATSTSRAASLASATPAESGTTRTSVAPASLTATATAMLPRLAKAWDDFTATYAHAHKTDASIHVNDALVASSLEGTPSFGTEALYVLLAFDGVGELSATDIVHTIEQVGSNSHVQVFTALWKIIDRLSAALNNMPLQEPQYALSAAWQETKVAERWQREALNNTADGRVANDRLDVAMRLFDYASGNGANRDVDGFIEQVRAMQIEADSLAKVAPIDQAITLTTPAGADGRHWGRIWIVAVQEGVWPNLAERNTMFGGEDLAQVMLHGSLSDDMQVSATGGDPTQAAILSAEQKTFLTAFTRGRTVSISAVYSDDMTPSDFLYTYMPERYDRERDADPQTRQYRQASHDDGFFGLDKDPRGLVAAARIVLAREPSIDTSKAVDAAATLAFLSDNGFQAADPSHWPFMPSKDGNGENENVSESTETDNLHQSVVTLSPSAVDGLWGCPVCWLMENSFAGPRMGSVVSGFGTIIHAVLQQATEEGLDAADYLAGRSIDDRIAAASNRMTEIYQDMRKDLDSIQDPGERYRAIQNDKKADDIFANVAYYFVASNSNEYLGRNAGKFEIGQLQKAIAERSFTALFAVDDILDGYNAIPGIEPITRSQLFAMMGMLVGGWPEAMNEELSVRLSGRIDREEIRVLADGSERHRLVDYKSGRAPTVPEIFNDLQLVCYQLGLAFPEGGARGSAALKAMPKIEQSVLFHVKEKRTPSESYAPESLYQPALFNDGHINDSLFATRSGYRDATRLMDVPTLPGTAPKGVSAHAWQQFIDLRGTQALWALTMISRVFYAAAARESTSLIAHPTAAHLQYCRMKSVCPACAGQVDTVFEIRAA